MVVVARGIGNIGGGGLGGIGWQFGNLALYLYYFLDLD